METERASVAAPATVNDFLPEIEPVTVSVSRETLKKLTLGADAFRELWNAAVESDDPALIDLISAHLDQLTDAGLVSAADGRTTEAFDVACTLGAICFDLTGGLRPDLAHTDDGDGVDGLADADNDDFEDDVSAAEGGFAPAADPDWPGEPQPSILDALPRAGSFAGD